jgi:hypothetical protein
MPRRSQQDEPEALRQELISLLSNFENELRKGDLRQRVLALVPSFHKLRDLGCSLVPEEDSGIDRILFYLRKYPFMIIHGDELMVVAGIGEWARRVRELRKKFGWSIVSGNTAREMAEEDESPLEGVDVSGMGVDDYILLNEEPDREAAHRWNIANTIRNKKSSVQDKVLAFLRQNVGSAVTGEELRYVAKDKSEWARRVRELRTELGWPVVTRNTGRPDLPVGTYLLEQDRQSPPHDRRIPDPVRAAVLRRDHYTCQDCGWNQAMWNRADPRHLELHHVHHHAKGGENDEANLVTICTVCHDERHRRER